MDKVKKLLDKCKFGVFLTVNEHRNYYQSVESRLKELSQLECPPEIDDAVIKQMVDLDTIIELQFYPDTPIGSYTIYHWDLDAILDEALECIDGKKDTTAHA